MPISSIDNAFRRGIGQAAKVIGTYFNVYRLGGLTGVPNDAQQLIDDKNRVFENFPMRIVRQEPKVIAEQTNIYPMVYIGLNDTRAFKPGDVCVEVAPQMTDTPDGRVFALADVQPLLPPVYLRCETMATLTRPHGQSSSLNEPILGLTDYQGESKFTEEIIVLNEGTYQYALSGTPATIPMGIQPYKRFSSNQEFKYPTATHRGLYFVYCPLLPGIQIQPGDVISDQNGNRFVIQVPGLFETGWQGYQMIAESLFT